MNNVMINLMISDFAKDIKKKKIEGGKLYGIPIDMNNPDHVIVAIYLMCEINSLNLWTERNKVLDSLSERR